MKLLAPSYYPNFSCIAGACKHSCCVGWEIEIDKESYERFSLLDGGSGRILDKIHLSGGEYCFKTDENGVCPFLNAEGLCDLIIEYTDACLCPICRDHPRFRSFFHDFTEIGLGLSCEEAARIILNDQTPFTLIPLSGSEEDVAFTEEEEELISIRDEMIGILEDTSVPIDNRIRALFDLAESDMNALDFNEISPFLLSLERLNEEWGALLRDLKDAEPLDLPADFHMPLQKMCVYFVYRHMTRSLDDADLIGAILLCAFLSYLAWQITGRACAKSDHFSMDSMISIARLMSGELEYSDENIDLIAEMLSELFS